MAGKKGNEIKSTIMINKMFIKRQITVYVSGDPNDLYEHMRGKYLLCWAYINGKYVETITSIEDYETEDHKFNILRVLISQFNSIK